MAVPGGPGAGYPGGYAPRPQIRFEVIGEAWQLFQQQAGQWVVAVIIAGVCVAIVDLIINAIVGGISGGAHVVVNQSPTAGLAMLPGLLGLRLVGYFIASIVGFFFQCGLFRMAARQLRGEAVSVGDLFSVTDVLPAVVVGSILYTIASWIGLAICCIGIVIPAGLLMFTAPLISDRRLTGVEALSTSWSALMSQALMAIVFFIVLWFINFVGCIPCFLGLLVTVPVSVLSVTLLYRDFFPDAFSGYPGAYPTAPAGTGGSATGSVYAPSAATPPAPTAPTAPTAATEPVPQAPSVRVEPAEPVSPAPTIPETTPETTPPPTGQETPPPAPGEP